MILDAGQPAAACGSTMAFVEHDRELAGHLGSVLVHGVQPVWLELADYDPWPDYFEPGHRCLRGSEAVLAVNLHCYAANAVRLSR